MNTIRIKVTSEDKTQSKEYIIKVTRTKDLELANTNLEILAVEDVLLNPPFDTNVAKYDTQVPNTASNVNVLAIPENEKGTVKITGNNNLKQGNNEVTIIVTAENGITKRNYTINVYKRNEEEEQQYQKEQAEQQEALEQAYQVEKLSTDNQKNDEDNLEYASQKNKTKLVAGISGIVVLIIIIDGIYYYHKKKVI